MIYYHITKGQHIQSIVKYGLIPAFKTGFCKMNPDVRRTLYPVAIFLTDDMDYIIDTQLTKGWIKRFRAFVLEIDCVNLNLIKRTKDWCADSHEYLCYTSIPYSRILSSKAL